MIRRLRHHVTRLAHRRFVCAQAWAEIDVIAVVSTGRTGTKRLSSLFSGILANVDARHEPRPDLFELATAYARGELTDAQATGRLLVQRASICRQLHQCKHPLYIESNNNMAYIVGVIRNAFPRCRFVHVTRDGRDFVRSAYSKTVRSRRPRGGPALFMTADDARRRFQACDAPGDPHADDWPRMNRFERLCWYWAKKDAILADSLDGDDTALRVRFEDIFCPKSGSAYVLELVDSLGLRDRVFASESEIRRCLATRENQTGEHRLPKWPQWTSDQNAAFERYCGDHMRRLGYW